MHKGGECLGSLQTKGQKITQLLYRKLKFFALQIICPIYAYRRRVPSSQETGNQPPRRRPA